LGSPGNPQRECVTVFEARHSPRAFPQLFRRRARPGANFQNMLAQFHTGQNPGKDTLPRHAAPDGRSTKPILEPIQRNTPNLPRKKNPCHTLLKEELVFQSLIIAGLRKL
jgi:hypothetical protein